MVVVGDGLDFGDAVALGTGAGVRWRASGTACAAPDTLGTADPAPLEPPPHAANAVPATRAPATTAARIFVNVLIISISLTNEEGGRRLASRTRDSPPNVGCEDNRRVSPAPKARCYRIVTLKVTPRAPSNAILMLVGRTRILSRIALSESRLISIVAPAGFGKTTIAKAIAEEHGPYAVCDVADVTDLQSFAQHIIRTVSQLAPERTDELANDLFRHLQPGVTKAQLAGFVLDVWSSADERNVYIFDNLEALEEQPEPLDLFLRLIKGTDERLLILCARPPFALLNSRLIPPNEHLRLGIDDLAFTHDETRDALDASLEEAQIDAVAAISRGWPVAVLLFRQLARLGQLDRTLAESSNSPPEVLRDYLLKEVLDSIRGPLFETLTALVATASVGIDAAYRATHGATSSRSVLDLCARLPLVTFADGKCTIHPLISSIVIRTAGPEIERYRRIAAVSYEHSGRLSFAARLFIDAGMVEDAARCLEGAVGAYVERNTWAGLDELVERLPPDILPKYPRLWAMLSWYRRGIVGIDVLIAEATGLREQLRNDLESLEAPQGPLQSRPRSSSLPIWVCPSSLRSCKQSPG